MEDREATLVHLMVWGDAWSEKYICAPEKVVMAGPEDQPRRWTVQRERVTCPACKRALDDEARGVKK